MKNTRYSDEQFVRILLESDEVKRLKSLESENARLRKLLVDRDLEIEVIKEINAKNAERTVPIDSVAVCHHLWCISEPGLCANVCFTLWLAR